MENVNNFCTSKMRCVPRIIIYLITFTYIRVRINIYIESIEKFIRRIVIIQINRQYINYIYCGMVCSYYLHVNFSARVTSVARTTQPASQPTIWIATAMYCKLHNIIWNRWYAIRTICDAWDTTVESWFDSQNENKTKHPTTNERASIANEIYQADMKCYSVHGLARTKFNEKKWQCMEYWRRLMLCNMKYVCLSACTRFDNTITIACT